MPVLLAHRNLVPSLQLLHAHFMPTSSTASLHAHPYTRVHTPLLHISDTLLCPNNHNYHKTASVVVRQQVVVQHGSQRTTT
jgi:hypothetical protein